MITQGVLQVVGSSSIGAEVGDGEASRIRVLLVEHDQACARAYRCSLAPHGIDVVFADGLASARRSLCDIGASIGVVLLDLHLPDGRGEALLSDIEALSNQPGIVIFSDDLDEIGPEATLYRPVLVPKSLAPAALAQILRFAATGYAHTTVCRFARHFGLTKRESQILERIATGTSPKEIASDDRCSMQAVYAHIAQIGRKTKCTGHQEVVAKLFQFSCNALGHCGEHKD